MYFFIVAPVLCNLGLRRVLNTMENVAGVCHVLFFIVAVVVLTTMSEKASTDFVFRTLTHDVSGWNNPTVAFSLGLLTTVFPTTSFDGILHMSKPFKSTFRNE
jgi:hypothetical protein